MLYGVFAAVVVVVGAVCFLVGVKHSNKVNNAKKAALALAVADKQKAVTFGSEAYKIYEQIKALL